MKRSVMYVVAVCVMSVVPAVCGASAPSPTTWLDRPLDGTSLPFSPATGPVIVQAHASDADGVATLEFFVDDVSLGSVPGGGGRLGEASVEWNPTAAGTYTVRARAIDAEGNVGPEDSSVVVVGELALASPTPTLVISSPTATLVVPSPTATPAPPEPTATKTAPAPWPTSGEVQISFTADRTSLQPGQCATLKWSVRGGEAVFLSGTRVKHSGERQVCPRSTTPYSLAAYVGVGPPEPPVAERELTIVVAELPMVVPTPTLPGPTEAPPGEVQVSLTADRTSLQPGECATLTWIVQGGFGVELNGQPVERSGELQVCPPETTVYKLAVDAGDRMEWGEVLISVAGEVEPPPAAAQEISANIWTDPDAITAGECAALLWDVGPPGNWRILLDGQPVAASGSQQVCPTSTKTYELLVEAPGGNVMRFATLDVAEGPGEEVPPPEPVPPAPGPAQGGSDVRPSDLFPQTGTVWTRITNDGHDTLSNNKVEVTLSGCGAGKQYALNIAPGQTQTIDTGCQAATGHNSYTVSVKAIDFTDPNAANNSYTEELDWQGAVAPPPPPSGPSQPPSGPSQPSGVDLALTDLFPQTLHGPVYGRITNRGPGSVSNLTIQFSCRWVETDAIEGIRKTNQVGPRNITITSLSPGQTTQFNTNISVELRQFQYDMSCTLHGPANDPSTANNSYSEKISR